MPVALRYLFLIGSLTLLGLLIVAGAGFAQELPLAVIGVTIAGVTALAVYFLFFEISIVSVLYLSPLLFIRQHPLLNLLYSLLLFSVFILEVLNRQSYRELAFPNLVFFVLLTVAAMHSLLVGVRGPHYLTFFHNEFLIPLLIMISVSNARISRQEMRTICKLHVFMASLLAFIGVALALTHPGERIGSLWREAMTINGYYVMAFFTGIGLMQDEKRKSLYFFLILLILMGMIFTYTRIILVGVLAGILMMGIRKPRFLLYSGLALLVVPFLLPSGLTSRVQETSGDMSLLIRFVAWYYSLHIIKAHWFWGLGFDSFVVKFKSFIPVKNLYAIHSHNIYLRLLVEMGLLGFIGYLGIVGAQLWHGLKWIKQTKEFTFYFMIWVAIIVELVFCLTDVFISQDSVSLFFWLLVAMLYRMTESAEEQREMGELYEAAA